VPRDDFRTDRKSSLRGLDYWLRADNARCSTPDRRTVYTRSPGAIIGNVAGGHLVNRRLPVSAAGHLLTSGQLNRPARHTCARPVSIFNAAFRPRHFLFSTGLVLNGLLVAVSLTITRQPRRRALRYSLNRSDYVTFFALGRRREKYTRRSQQRINIV